MNALEALAQGPFRPIDVVRLGNSNENKNAYGAYWAWAKALIGKAGMYATPIGMYPGLGGPSNGWPFGVTPSPTTVNPTGGASPVQLTQAFPDVPSQTGSTGTSPGGSYGYIADGASISAGSSVFCLNVNPVPGVDVAKRWRCTYFWGGQSSGSGSFNPFARGTANYSQLALAPAPIATNIGAETLRLTPLEVPADPLRTQGIQFQWKQHGVSAVTGPFIGYGWRAENLDAMSGYSVHCLYGVGGQSLYDLAAQVNSWSDAQLTNFFAETQRLQKERGFDPITVVMINLALNDLNETVSPSLGYRASTAPTSAAAYIDNLEAIIYRLESIYQMNGWRPSGLKFVVSAEHPVPDAAVNARLSAFAKALASFATGRDNISFLGISNRVSAATMLANGWYMDGGTDYNHQTGPTTKPASGPGSIPPYGYEGVVSLLMPVIFPA